MFVPGQSYFSRLQVFMNIAHTKTNLDPGPRRPKGGLILGAPHAVIPWVTPYYQTQAKRSTLKNPRPHHCSWGDM